MGYEGILIDPPVLQHPRNDKKTMLEANIYYLDGLYGSLSDKPQSCMGNLD